MGKLQFNPVQTWMEWKVAQRTAKRPHHRTLADNVELLFRMLDAKKLTEKTFIGLVEGAFQVWETEILVLETTLQDGAKRGA